MTEPVKPPEKLPTLPRWFAAKGPVPGWLAEHWSRILAVVSAVAVLLNTVVTMPGIDLNAEKWINAALAWLTAAALWLQSRQQRIADVAAWRAAVRAEEQKGRHADRALGKPTDEA